MKSITKTIIICAVSALAIVVSLIIVLVVNRVLRKANEEKRRQIRQKQRQEADRLLEEEKSREKQEINQPPSAVSSPAKPVNVPPIKHVQKPEQQTDKVQKPDPIPKKTTGKKIRYHKDESQSFKEEIRNKEDLEMVSEKLELGKILTPQQLENIRTKKPRNITELVDSVAGLVNPVTAMFEPPVVIGHVRIVRTSTPREGPVIEEIIEDDIVKPGEDKKMPTIDKVVKDAEVVVKQLSSPQEQEQNANDEDSLPSMKEILVAENDGNPEPLTRYARKIRKQLGSTLEEFDSDSAEEIDETKENVNTIDKNKDIDEEETLEELEKKRNKLSENTKLLSEYEPEEDQ